jgi:hypothetical protein
MIVELFRKLWTDVGMKKLGLSKTHTVSATLSKTG